MRALPFLFFLFCLAVSEVGAQISPPGLGYAKTAYWMGFGVKQHLDSARRWESSTYVGLGRKSRPDLYDPFRNPAIWVLNQEVYRALRRSFRVSFAVSRREQHEYSDLPPYRQQDPAIRNELRFYGRISRKIWWSRFTLTPTLRQEVRRFSVPAAFAVENELQFRTRFRLKLIFGFDRDGRYRVILTSEQLFSQSRDGICSAWSEFGYRESRFTLFYSWSNALHHITVNIGYMNDLVGTHQVYDVHYLAVNLVLRDMFW